MARRRKSGSKGSYSRQRLPAAGAYPPTDRRARLLRWGAVAAAVVLAAVVWDRVAGSGAVSSGGPLSSSHAAFGDDCSNCHASGQRRVTAESCSICHEKHGDELGTFSFAAHYVYRSDDFRRVVPSPDEAPCFRCHDEHRGRHAQITAVPDRRCRSCHFDSFGRRHPEFRFAAENEPDDDALAFGHLHHLREVMKRLGSEEVERACLACHNPRPDGRSFEPLDFDRHCDACHLTATTATPGLPFAGADGVRVATLEELAASGGPGLRWVYFSNPAEFRYRGDRVVKAPVHHRDPWILENLRRVRRRLYPDAGLADLLRASAEAPPHRVRDLYREAVATLEEYAVGLRARPEPAVRRELAGIEALLAAVGRRIEEPLAPLDETAFLLALERRDPALSAEEVAALEALAGELAAPCSGCHRVENATIARVETDQRRLRRAEFDHRAHVVQARCWDCHAEIPLLEPLESGAEPDPAVDRAAVQNLPRIAVCRRCHNPELASDRCVTCHLFHPDQGRRADLLLYAEPET